MRARTLNLFRLFFPLSWLSLPHGGSVNYQKILTIYFVFVKLLLMTRKEWTRGSKWEDKGEG